MWAYRAIARRVSPIFDYWTDLAETLERSKFDGISLADVLGIYDVYSGSPNVALATRCRCRSTIRSS